jgi:hypothetical protein
VESAGVRFVAMTGKANYDYRDIELHENKSLSGEDPKLHMLRSRFADTICGHQVQSYAATFGDRQRVQNLIHAGGVQLG